MYKVMGLINLHESMIKLDVLTSTRPLAAVPFGAKYRIIDFVLSNMVNSSIYNVGVLVPENSGALIQHLRAGTEWDLDRKRDGLFLLLPQSRTPLAGTGDIDYYSQHLDYLTDSKYDYVIIATSQFLCNLDYRAAVEHHRKSKSDVTLIYRRMSQNEKRPLGSVMLTFDKSGWVSDMEIDPPVSKSRNMHMRMCVVSKKLLVDIIAYAMSRGGGDFVRQLQSNVNNLSINAWEFTGYAANIADINEYYKHSLALLDMDVWKDLFFSNGHIYTKVKDSVPAQYMPKAEVINSLLANNCRVNGRVENCVLFRSVYIDKGAQVKNSVIMQDSYIGANVNLENVICDKDVEITPGRILRGDPEYPLVIKKGTVV